MSVTVKQLLKQLGNSGVMSEPDITAFVDSLNTPPEDSQQLAKALIQQKKLTKFQTQMIARGKGKSLTLQRYVIKEKIGDRSLVK